MEHWCGWKSIASLDKVCSEPVQRYGLMTSKFQAHDNEAPDIRSTMARHEATLHFCSPLRELDKNLACSNSGKDGKEPVEKTHDGYRSKSIGSERIISFLKAMDESNTPWSGPWVPLLNGMVAIQKSLDLAFSEMDQV